LRNTEAIKDQLAFFIKKIHHTWLTINGPHTKRESTILGTSCFSVRHELLKTVYTEKQMKGSLICTTLTLYMDFFDVEGLHRSDVDGQQLWNTLWIAECAVMYIVCYKL
jgi:hypothetical protein